MAINRSIIIDLLWSSLEEGLNSFPIGENLYPLYPPETLLFFFHLLPCSRCPWRGRDKRKVNRYGVKVGLWDKSFLLEEKDHARSFCLFSFQPVTRSAPALQAFPWGYGVKCTPEPRVLRLYIHKPFLASCYEVWGWHCWTSSGLITPPIFQGVRGALL